MKKLSILTILLTLTYFVSAQDLMRVHQKNGTVTEFPLSDIEKVTYTSGTQTPSGNTVTDIDGNVYKTVKIGSQTWMKENLRVTKFRDGSPIANVMSNAEWNVLSTPAYCWYDNKPSPNKMEYGALYNFFVVETNQICPSGWHVPINTEWAALFEYLGGSKISGGKMKEPGTANWNPPNMSATNSSGFSAKPGGFRNGTSTNIWFTELGKYAKWWSFDRMVYNVSSVFEGASGTIQAGNNLKSGYSIRCIQD